MYLPQHLTLNIDIYGRPLVKMFDYRGCCGCCLTEVVHYRRLLREGYVLATKDG